MSDSQVFQHGRREEKMLGAPHSPRYQRRLAYLMISAWASVLHLWPEQMEIKAADLIPLYHLLTYLHLS